MFLIALLWPAFANSDDGRLALAVKAAYLLKLPQFVNWPAAALPPASFALCVVGHDPFGDLLDRVAAGQTVDQRPVVVRRYATIAANPGCQLMFDGGSETQTIPSELADVRGTAVLTVTDGQSSPDAIGIVNFVVVGGRVRFEIDRSAAATNGLAISSKLLRLAVRTAQ